jgi:large subunit ribosomal protein L21
MTILKQHDNYAVIRIAGKQYKVSEGKEILVDRLADIKDISPDILLTVNDGNVKVGKPTIKDTKIVFDVINQEEKQEKIRVFKYKSKSRYRKHVGFRAQMTRLLVKSIS